ncbi:hypothetical protein AWZ03_010845 [Drosophila navojoa]|uniref:Nudix hydrolase domain-containing protein n=1 Tax=Drosophila navojoa TaxID=7232 RepID=A0A484B293_DRONA|nr:nucleoside diphosphate-linked moiety X motif 19 [Drosophila navojoa]TDG42739.1 hypothetical protein AWZ03_010845 [Drosophila navojoa]
MASSDQIQYRPSASLILANKQVFHAKKEFDYNLLLMKRTERTSYALNHCVFPGGVFDAQADESADWLIYFQQCGVSRDQLKLLHSRQSMGRPELMTQGLEFSRDISLRLTALREAFEEVGILLCRKNLKNLKGGQPAQVVQLFDREYWQQRVHNDAQQFLVLCRHLAVVPDLWALNEWSIWRTPASAASRKYDTVYYLAALDLDCNVDLLLEPTEVAAAYWLQPSDCWLQSREGLIWLPYILLYETARLMSIQRWQQLLQFAYERSPQGSTLLQPIYYRTNDCLIGVLPGDELYLPEPEYCNESIVLPCSISELNAVAKRFNRYMIYSFQHVDFACNVHPLDGHFPLQTRVNALLAKL